MASFINTNPPVIRYHEKREAPAVLDRIWATKADGLYVYLGTVYAPLTWDADGDGRNVVGHIPAGSPLPATVADWSGVAAGVDGTFRVHGYFVTGSTVDFFTKVRAPVQTQTLVGTLTNVGGVLTWDLDGDAADNGVVKTSPVWAWRNPVSCLMSVALAQVLLGLRGPWKLAETDAVIASAPDRMTATDEVWWLAEQVHGERAAFLKGTKQSIRRLDLAQLHRWMDTRRTNDLPRLAKIAEAFKGA